MTGRSGELAESSRLLVLLLMVLLLLCSSFCCWAFKTKREVGNEVRNGRLYIAGVEAAQATGPCLCKRLLTRKSHLLLLPLLVVVVVVWYASGRTCKTKISE